MDATLFKKLLKQEKKALATAWESFISIQKEGKVPYPSLYSQVFTRKQGKQKDEEPEILKILEEASQFLGGALKKIRKESPSRFTLSLRTEEVITLYQLRKRIENLEKEISFLKEELLRDPLTNFWNLRGLQRIFDYAVKPHIYSEDYLILVFYILLPEDKEYEAFTDKIIRACAHFLQGLFSPRDFLSRPSERTFAVICVGQKLSQAQKLIELLKNKTFPCRLKGHSLAIRYLVGGTNILGADHLNLVLDRALSAAEKGTFIRV